MSNTVQLHRVLTTTPDKVYRAFVEPDAIASWLPPFGFLCHVHKLEPRQGGEHQMSFRNFTTGESHSFGGTYLELIPGEKLVYSDSFDDPALPGEMTVTVTFKAVSVDTELFVEQRGIPDQIPVEACYLGWQQSLRKLTELVQPDIRQQFASDTKARMLSREAQGVFRAHAADIGPTGACHLSCL